MTSLLAPEELHIQTPFLALRAKAWGPEDGEPVLALHGWLDNAESFSPIAPYLDKYRLVALDLPGHGFSQWKAPGTHYHYLDYCPEVLLAADALGWQQFRILGHSYGASIALGAAAMEPERIAQIALIDNIGPHVDSTNSRLKRLRKSYIDLKKSSTKTNAIFKSANDALRARKMAGNLDEKNIKILFKRGLKAHRDGYTWTSDPQLKMSSPYYLHEQQLLTFLGAVSAPCLLIRAMSGYLAKRLELIKRYDQMSDLTIVDLPGGHHLHMQSPEPVAQHVNTFFSKK